MSRFIKTNGANWVGFGNDKFEESEKLVQEHNTGVIPHGYYDEDDEPKRKKMAKTEVGFKLKQVALGKADYDETMEDLKKSGWTYGEISAINDAITESLAYASDGLGVYGEAKEESFLDDD